MNLENYYICMNADYSISWNKVGLKLGHNDLTLVIHDVVGSIHVNKARKILLWT
jgi:hypothetical protein